MHDILARMHGILPDTFFEFNPALREKCMLEIHLDTQMPLGGSFPLRGRVQGTLRHELRMRKGAGWMYRVSQD